jgi:hypothetical protein
MPDAGCTNNDQCPTTATCKLCPDGTPSCAYGLCDNGVCKVAYPPCAVGNGGTSGAGGSNGTGGSTAVDHWFRTCGGPACRVNPGGGTGPGNGNGIPLCTTEKAGDACSPEGAECDLSGDCTSYLVCAPSDPNQGGACPE